MGSIDWIPAADIPEALKDGREVLLWEADSSGKPHRFGCHTGAFAGGHWYVSGEPRHVAVTHIAEINRPEEGR